MQIKSIEDLIRSAKHQDPQMQKDVLDLEKKSNENVNITQNANWYDAYGVVNSIKDLSSKNGNIMPRLAGGYEGDGLPKSYPVPYDITNYFLKGKTAWTDSAVPAVSAQQVSDAKVTLTPTSMILQMNITDEMIDHATDKRIRDYILRIILPCCTQQFFHLLKFMNAN